MIGVGQAGKLGGSSIIAFNAVEIIARDGKKIERRIIPYADVKDYAGLDFIERSRPAMAGLAFETPRIMGVVNVTPDSFSDGGLHSSEEQGIAHGLTLAKEGADILDVGGESTRPGSDAVDVQEELRRVTGVVRALAGKGHAISVDTRKAAVMKAAAEAGATVINDVSALSYDPDSLRTLAELKRPVILMHAQGDPRTMQLNPSYDDVALDVYDFLEARIATCEAAGISRDMITVDPGIGFGKTFRHNLDLLHQITLFHGLGVAVLVGLSRKGFVGAVTGEKLAVNRVSGSVGGALHAALHGVHILRVHDVKATVQALAMAFAAVAPDATEF
jgi:dihydropteroate synthase